MSDSCWPPTFDFSPPFTIEMETLILNTKVPEPITSAITDELAALEKIIGPDVHLALRSSAVKEDGKVSFAGQYRTLLDVKKRDIIEGYKQVIVGKYSAGALFYRISHGILDDETPMAVLVLEMIDAKASGIIYTTPIP